MNIKFPDLTSNKIFLSPEGEALLSPLLYILASLKGTSDYNEVNLLQTKYNKYSICYINEYSNTFTIKPQLINLLLEMSGNLSTYKVQETNFLYRMIERSTSIENLYTELPEIEI
jgi:hypothetical protein